MSVVPESKRKRTDDSDEDYTSLQDAYEELSKHIHVYFGLKAAMKELAFIDVIQGARVATYKYALNKELTHTVPSEFTQFTIGRNKKGEVISIGDDDGQINGRQLAIVQAMGAAVKQDAGHVILDVVSDDTVSGLMIPRAFLAEDAPPATDAEVTVKYVIYTAKARVKSFITNSELEELLRLKQVKIGQIPDLVAAFSHLKEKDKDFKLDSRTHSSITSLRSALNSADIKERHRSLLSKLMSLAVLDKSYDDRVAEFVKAPSFQFASDLRLNAHHRAEIYSKSTQQKVKLVKLADVDDSAKVVLSSVSLDSKTYDSLPDPSALLVYPWSDDLALPTKVKNQWKEVRNVFGVTAATYKAFVQAAQGKDTAGKKTDADADEFEDANKEKATVELIKFK